MKRTIAMVTTSRADYSLLYWPLKDMASHPDLDVKIIAMGSHLSPEFGCTIQEIESDGFRVDMRVECLLSSDSDIGMAKTIGVATLSLAESLGRMRPDLLVLTADRYEMLAPAAVALALRIPVAHIEGGEISEGAIDDAVRNALTKLSHVHFTSTETARARVVSMGEEDWRVHRVGAPALDHLRRATLLSRQEIEARLGLDLAVPSAVVTFHPVTIARDTTREADAFFTALQSISGQILFCYPNADAGSRALIERVKAFAARRANTRLFVNLEPIVYWSLLQHVDLLLGNSSSGIIEAASLELPVVNVGIRQRGREHGRNVLDAEAVTNQILDRVATAQSERFRLSLKGMENLYGDGCASGRIVEVMASVKLGEELLIKRAPSP
jgi:UDP-N-acetylglucosamine 2-epimerase (non-hydrolysing)/GDP/UDP-N,N'-diacetylbacillosamine 2-epimerase (hydrolysing)